ncbi:MAG: hypothetical protein P4M07_04960 [Xanthobacteraceae bacterium]|nr:hypothetical protein [Xanthobacteraceae bacterium]
MELLRRTVGVVLPSSHVQVIIFGEHSPDWMAALAHDAPVWKRVAGTVVVSAFAETHDLPKTSRKDSRTVAIPLMEVHTRRCPRRYRSLIPDDRSIDVLSDKGAFATYVAAEGLSHLCPPTYPGPSDAGYPCVLKRLDLNGGVGVAVAQSRSDLDTFLEQAPWRDNPYILQSLVSGSTEYVTHCVCKEGRILWHCTFACELNSAGIVRDASTTSTMSPSVALPSTISAIEALLAPLGYTGPCNVDYKLTEGGRIAVFEVNPRLGGSLMVPGHEEYLAGALSCIIRHAERRAGPADPRHELVRTRIS